MILLNNCPHNNGIYTLRDEDSGRIIKSTYSQEGRQRLQNEFVGFNWYLDQKLLLDDKRPFIGVRDESHYKRLSIEIFPGRSGNPYKSLTYNRKLLLLAIDSYKTVWPKASSSLFPLHGDFSVGNIIYNKNNIYIIDWEHFRENAAPWGFDLVNLLYESVFFSFQGNNTISYCDIEIYILLRNIISKLLPKNIQFDCNLESLIEFMSKNFAIFNPWSEKLPVTKFSDHQKKYLKTLEENNV